MQTLPRTQHNVNPQSVATYVTLASAGSATGIYKPIIRDDRGSRPCPIYVHPATPRNVLSMAMSYAASKGFPFRLEHPELASEAASVQAELAENYGIVVEVKAATIKVVCAWCGKDLGTQDDPDGRGGVSHGTCGDCAEKFRKESKPSATGSLTAEVTDAEIDELFAPVEPGPDQGWEFTDEELNELFTGEAKRVASDPMLARWEADGSPGGFTFTRDFADVRCAEDREDWIGA